ncbi:MAG: RNA methyltransferase [Blautia sp.]|nr:RNA methyltransferase [Blautia sp.]
MDINNIRRVVDFEDPELDVYARLNEVQLRRFNEPDPGIFIAESPNVISRALLAGYKPVSFLIEERYLNEAESVIARSPEATVYTAPLDVLKKLTGFPMTRGALCAMRRKKLKNVQEICRDAKRIVILEDVENPTNVGAIFRSAAALGMDAVLLTESCSDPLYRRASRVSMGTVFQIPYTYISNETLDYSGCRIDDCRNRADLSDGFAADCSSAKRIPAEDSIQKGNVPPVAKIRKDSVWPGRGMKLIREMGFRTAAMALSDESISVDDPVLKTENKLAVIMGAEGTGLSPETIKECDYTVKIPMFHGVDSLNVAAASAVAFWELRKPE